MPADTSATSGWKVVLFNVLVTGKGEEKFIGRFLRSLADSGHCSFRVVGDVKDVIRHPKNDLKALVAGFDEVEHGNAIVRSLDLIHVLSRPDTCAALRALFARCCKAIGHPSSTRYPLADGIHDMITGAQLARLSKVGSGESSMS